IDVHPDRTRPIIPELEIGGKPFVKQQGLALLPPFTVEFERQIHYERLVAARAYVRANGLDRIVVRGGSDRLGLVAAGKTYTDLMQALELLGLCERELRQAGIRIYKPAMIAPIEREGLAEFAEGLEEIVVVEEKRGFTEVLIRDALYNQPSRPAVYGKLDRNNQPLFPINNEMDVDQIARILAGYLAERLNRPDLVERVNWLVEIEERPVEDAPPRTPYFCSGCPHNTSTKMLDGEQVGGGIGCHAMAAYMNRGVAWLTHMGGEGGPWMGLSAFVDKDHIFQNVGDGTFYHSASKAVEACVAAGTNITYRLLYNSAVAMTGGQQVIGGRPPIELAKQLEAQGVKEIVIVPEKEENYPRKKISPKIRVVSKEHYNDAMMALKKVKGVTVILFDQQCAAEKRRERKRGIQPTPRKRVFINESVCEGCGDCGVKSNCLSVIPVETPYGRKTRIHQSSCNMDYSCLKGDCPAFMTVELGPQTKPVRAKGQAGDTTENPPEPAQKVACDRPYKVLLVGIGGTGVVTADALLVTAALIEGKYAVHLDQTGLAQKGGAVVSNLTIGIAPIEHANKISAGEADLVIAFDLLATVARENMKRYHPERTAVIGNTARMSTAQEVTDIHAVSPTHEALTARLAKVTRKGRNVFFNSERITSALFGDHLTNNLFMLGVAYQAGLLPLEAASIEEAILVNGVAVEQNLKAFHWGRRYIHAPEAVEAIAGGEEKAPEPRAEALARLSRYAPRKQAAFEALEARFPKGDRLAALLYPRVAELILYQNEHYAAEYLDFVAGVDAAERAATAGRTELTETVARWFFKLMA
ncbi:MAG: indolepyruvate ferredoxin oxidoreductase family protein, partial [bacterium]